VSWLLAKEILERNPEKATTLREKLGAIGWKIDLTRLFPADAKVDELFFPRRSEHDAYVEIRSIQQSATKSILIIDPYLDGSVFTLL
jgi:hypothetical protein